MKICFRNDVIVSRLAASGEVIPLHTMIKFEHKVDNPIPAAKHRYCFMADRSEAGGMLAARLWLEFT